MAIDTRADNSVQATYDALQSALTSARISEQKNPCRFHYDTATEIARLIQRIEREYPWCPPT